ncbi:MAG TPA: hypothetical protein PK500_06340 [Candidatus Egerieousia sp.]|nr:hypothetical protein [Candidatus Egerieousia sp.]HPT06252.1 hypothetical protein [Candidatus Egerieousia sp.]
MKKVKVAASTILLLFVLSQAVNAQVRATKEFTNSDGNTWIRTYPRLCKLDSSVVNIEEEIKGLLLKCGVGWTKDLFHLSGCKMVKINDKGVFMTTVKEFKKGKKGQDPALDTVICVLPFGVERNLYVDFNKNNWYETIDNLGPLGNNLVGADGLDKRDVLNRLCNILFTLQYGKIQEATELQLNMLRKSMSESKTKQDITEEQRMYIVQANALTEQKLYSDAIEQYYNAMKINPISYPTMYYNIALLQAQIENFGIAILNMKKYLLLAPDAQDARTAQDKIYEWQLNFRKE